MSDERPSHISRALFLEWRDARRGTSNPEKQTNPWWVWVIQEDLSGCSANSVFDGPSSLGGQPAWCFERFGQSKTTLPDGRVVCIAGEHEDYYDPDFFIYNDVTVLAPNGVVEIFGYPEDIFAPTDFHSASLLDDHIIVIGSVGYSDERHVGHTQVVRFTLDTWRCEGIETHGEGPGWISSHQATWMDDGKSLLITGGKVWRGDSVGFVENNHDWSLDCSTWTWSVVKRRSWLQFRFTREDEKSNHLFKMEMASFRLEQGWDGAEQAVQELTEALGCPPNFALYKVLYQPDFADEVIELEGDEYNVSRIRKDGVDVRYEEGTWHVKMVIEGELPPSTVDALCDDLKSKLERLGNHPWTFQKTVLD